jgi:hypothetical protein
VQYITHLSWTSVTSTTPPRPLRATLTGHTSPVLGLCCRFSDRPCPEAHRRPHWPSIGKACQTREKFNIFHERGCANSRENLFLQSTACRGCHCALLVARTALHLDGKCPSPCIRRCLASAQKGRERDRRRLLNRVAVDVRAATDYSFLPSIAKEAQVWRLEEYSGSRARGGAEGPKPRIGTGLVWVMRRRTRRP